MKRPTKLPNTHRALSVLLAALLTAAAHGGPRNSASYTVATDTADAGGKRTASASYTNDGSVGGIAGISIVGSPAEVAKHGYIGQLYDLASGIFLAATPATINEGGTRQLAAARNLDDGTGLALDPATIAWSVLGGPLTGISTGGAATAGTVYQHTAASVQGIASGFTASLSLTVLNVNLDDFGSYAGDGLDDAWQNQYFGLNNLNAAPALDPDGDGQTNAFEFTAGLVPTDPASRFLLSVAPVAGQPGQKNLVFSPRFADRTYTVKAKASLLTGSYLPLTNPSAPSDNGQERTITDLSANGATKFYRIEITKP